MGQRVYPVALGEERGTFGAVYGVFDTKHENYIVYLCAA
jgi:hypothetical protein